MIDQETKENARRRLLSIKGQVQGIQQMIEDEKYCVDILIQLSAAKAALGKVSAIILKRHVESCVVNAIESGSEEEMAEVMNKFQADLTARQQKEFSEQSARNREQASLFLAENAGKQGVTTLPDSLQYEVMTDGTGAVPKLSDTVKVHYRGSFLDGTVFDSSKPDNPIELSVTGVIKGWTEALQLMKTGSKWKIYIPPELGYGERGYPPNIPPNALLIFEIELMEIVK